MRGERAPRDLARARHNKDLDNLKSSLKKGAKVKKHRVVFNESANEFFEADYIIVVRDECTYEPECAGCGACCEEPGALSPPEGYKDMGLFNRDGTLREQAWWDAGDVVLVGERSGTVFTPQHLALLRRLQRERMLRAAAEVCTDCDRGHPGAEYYDEEESDEVEKELRPMARRTGKQIAAGEERPKTNSSQQTTPTEDCPLELCLGTPHPDTNSVALTSEESDTGDNDGHNSSDSSPHRHRKGGILKGGRLWKSSLDDKEPTEQQAEDQRSATASDEDGSTTPRSVRFEDRSRDASEDTDTDVREMPRTRVESPLANQSSKNSAVHQLFTAKRPPPPLTETTPITAETLRAWDAGSKKSEELAIRRVGERNNLRCSLLRSEARKKQQPKPKETTSLAERIRILTCDVEDEPEDTSGTLEGQAAEPTPATAAEKTERAAEKVPDKFDRNEKAFGSSSSSSSSTASAPAPLRHQPDLGDHQEPAKVKPRETRRQFLSTLAPLTACVGSGAHHEGFYYMAAERASMEPHEHDQPAPDVLAGTPGAHDADDGLAAFARANAPRTERLRRRYGQESQPVSSDDEHDDYGFHRRPAVRGIVARTLGASEAMLQQAQSELGPAPAHAHCQRAAAAPRCDSRPASRASAVTNWSKSSDYVTGRQCGTAPPEAFYTHQGAAFAYTRQEAYRANCSIYANIGCSDSSQDLYSSQTSSEQASPARGRCRRPESPPPIRAQHQLYVPCPPHERAWPNDYNRMQYYQQQGSGASTPQPMPPPQSSRAQYTHALHLQSMCPAPARYKPVPAPPPGGGKQMICYSEKVAAPQLYHPAPGSPSRARGAAEAPAPASTSPVAAPPNSVYYAMNV